MYTMNTFCFLLGVCREALLCKMPDSTNRFLLWAPFLSSSMGISHMSNLELPDLPTVNLTMAIRGISRKRPRRNVNVSVFERKIVDQSAGRPRWAGRRLWNSAHDSRVCRFDSHGWNPQAGVQ